MVAISCRSLEPRERTGSQETLTEVTLSTKFSLVRSWLTAWKARGIVVRIPMCGQVYSGWKGGNTTGSYFIRGFPGNFYRK